MAAFTALEFFSGIGAFSAATAGTGVTVIGAFDQNRDANEVYRRNHGLAPSARNLDTISAEEIIDSEIWWMSPPCKPYSIRGKQQDAADRRAQSLARLLEILELKRPGLILLENVAAFAQSQMHAQYVQTLQQLNYILHEQNLCPTQFGIPMRRPRLFIAAIKKDFPARWSPQAPESRARPIAAFLDEHPAAELLLDAATAERYGRSFDIIEDAQQWRPAICFTSGYYKCMKASGSYISTTSGIRRFSPEEMLRLFGFPAQFRMPVDMPLQTQWRLIGNSVSIACIKHMLMQLGITCDTAIA